MASGILARAGRRMVYTSGLRPPVFIIFPLRYPMFVPKTGTTYEYLVVLNNAQELLCIIVDHILCTLHVLF